ncbi:LamG domain-containing protein [Oceanobacter mangrovi]|uniref:LamG domain-containing protein n=1 Tax=Oceanobacter mangrovi TaxID=2862510 RepID=UPI001C8D8110|nr:LamG domain-containing protein [Oceanobacter mangrovi]
MRRWLMVMWLLLVTSTGLALPTPVALYHLDESSYSGVSSEVVDSSGNGLHGRAYNTVTLASSSPAVSGYPGSCRYGEFNGSGYLQVADNALLDFRTAVSVGAWVRLDRYNSELSAVVSKDENYEFHIDASGRVYWWWVEEDGDTRWLYSNSTIPLNTWTHIAVTYTSGRQTIYINGTANAVSYYSDPLMRNSDPLQIGADQNMSGRYLVGDIDEVAIFNRTLSSSEVAELVAQTHVCSSGSSGVCSDAFPGGISSHNSGSIYFDYNAQLQGNGSTSLSAGSVSRYSSSYLYTCQTADCVSSGQSSAALEQAAFEYSSSTTNYYVLYLLSASVGPTQTDYGNITQYALSSLTFRSSSNGYHIRSLYLDYDATLYLPAGDYWIESLTLGTSANILVSGSGTVRLHVLGNISMASYSGINATSRNNMGDASQMIIYGYGNLTTDTSTYLSGLVYTEGNVSLGYQSVVKGAISANNVTVGNAATVLYDASAVVNTSFGDLCSNSSCTLGGFDISQPEYSLACPVSRAEITIQAMCDDGVTAKDDYLGTISLSSTEASASLFYDAASAGNQISSVTFAAADAGLKTVYLYHENENSDLRVIATDSSSGTSSTSSEGTDVRTQAFLMTTTPEDFVCGAATSLRLVAVGEDQHGSECQQLTNFAGNRDLKVWFNANLTQPPQAAVTVVSSTSLVVNGTAISDQSKPTANNLTVKFDSGEADLTLAYGNAAQIETINFVFDQAAYASLPLVASTSSFVVRPDHIDLAVSTANSSCSTADASCSPFVAAGAEFDMTATAVCSDGSTATDFVGAVTLDSTLQAPAGGSEASLGTASINLTDADNGSLAFTQTVSEVGVFSLSADADYFDNPLTTSYFSNLGRFYPASFNLSRFSLQQQCDVGVSAGFVYMGYPGISLDYQLQALNVAGAVTTNYIGSFAKAGLNWLSENADDGVDRSSRLSGMTTDSWSEGVLSGSQLLAFDRQKSAAVVTVDGPYTALSIGLGLSDNDGSLTSLEGMDMNPATTGSCSGGNCSGVNLGAVEARFGRLELENAFGPEGENLQQQVGVYYYNSASGRWLLNTDDSCSGLTLDSTTLVSSNWTGNLNAGETAVSLAQAITAGKGILLHAAPGVGNDGSVTYRYAASAWLLEENDEDDDYADDPSALIQFGQYRGNDRIIYWRDIVR